MLFLLKQHLNKRGIFKFEYLERFKDQQLSCKVCDLWYLLVIAEHELIEVEKLFGKALNIPVKDEHDPKPPKNSKPINAEFIKEMESRKISSDIFTDKLLQLRLLFYFHDILDMTLSELSHKGENNWLYLQIKLFDFITRINIYDTKKPIDSPLKRNMKAWATPRNPERTSKNISYLATLEKRKSNIYEDKDQLNFGDVAHNSKEYLLKKMRVHYFFTEKNANLDEFLEKTEIEVRITDGKSWENVIASATCTPFIHFKVTASLNI